jgi:hypothetical protein
MKYKFEQAPARWVAFIQALVVLAAAYVQDLPVEAVVTIIVTLLGLNEYVQKVEDAKTYDAFLVDPSIPSDPDGE